MIVQMFRVIPPGPARFGPGTAIRLSDRQAGKRSYAVDIVERRPDGLVDVVVRRPVEFKHDEIIGLNGNAPPGLAAVIEATAGVPPPRQAKKL